MKRHSGTKSRKKKKGRSKVVSRRSYTEVVLRDEVERCLDKKYKDLVEHTYGSESEEDSYWTWLNTVHSFGYAAVTTSLLNMKIMYPEHVSYDKYLSTKERVGAGAMMEGINLMMCLTHEILDQLVNGIRNADERWPRPIRNLIHVASDLVVIAYATNKELESPPDVVQRCQIGVLFKPKKMRRMC